MIDYFRFDYKIRFILSLILIFFVIFISYHHEFWRDEGHMINMAIALDFSELLREARYEGFFPIHQILLKILFFFSENKEFSLKFLTISFYITTTIILFKYSEINNYTFFLILLSYPIFFEYSVLTKHYGFLVPSIIYLIFEKEKKIGTLIFNIIFLCSTGIFGIIISFSYCITNFNFFYKLLKKKFLLIFFFLLLCTYFSWFLLPVYDRLWNPIRIPDFKIIFEVISKLFLSVFYVPNYFSNNFSISGHFVLFFFLTLSIIFILLIFLNFFNKRNILINSNFYLVTNFLFVLFFLITTHHTWRHYYIFSIFSYFFAAKLISLKKKEKDSALNHINKRDQWFQYTLKKFFTFTLIISCLGNFLISSGDVKFNFSNSKNLSAHLKFKKISCGDVLTYPGYAASSWTVYFNEECKNLFLENYKQNSFYSLKGVDTQSSHYFKYYEDLILSSNKNYLVLLCQVNCNQERADLIKIIKIRETDMSIFNEPFLRNDHNEKFILAKLR